MTPCSLADEYQRFGRTYCRCLHTVLVWRWLAHLGEYTTSILTVDVTDTSQCVHPLKYW